MTSPIPTSSDEKLWAGLSYAGAPFLAIPPIAIFVLKKGESDHIKFHALQATGVFLALLILGLILGVLMMVPIVNMLVGLVSFIVWIGELVLWVWLMWQAFTGGNPRIPVLADQIDAHFMGA